MNHLEFVDYTICSLGKASFEKVKEYLLNNYLSFAVIKSESITEEILAEKVCDYFSVVEKMSFGQSFNKLLEQYMKELDSLVEPRISKDSSSRARKYYSRISNRRRVDHIYEYTRVMMCLYDSIRRTNDSISNFDFSIDQLDPYIIVESLKKERKKKFNDKPKYDIGAFNSLVLFLILCSVTDDED